jgi:phage terminase large subunit GpA-like protein
MPLLSHLWTLFEPGPIARMRDWCAEHVTLAGGVPWDGDAYPHLVAPGGPCDAVDDAGVRVIWLMFGTRLGKTSFALAFLLFTQASCPAPAMLATADQKLAQEQVVTKLYPMLEASPLAAALRAKHQRNDDRVDLAASRIYVAWARSPATLADRSIKYGVANEIDKWEHVSTSREADPLELFAERHKDWPRHKSVREGTPTVRGQSRIANGLAQSSDCRYHVPCPQCRRYQVLQLGDGSPGGLLWEKTGAGQSDPDLAGQTARYVCGRCEVEIEDDRRGWMLRRGVWAPAGCGVDDRKALRAAEARRAGDDEGDYLTGVPHRRGPEAGYQLGSLYALSLGWGDYARAFVRAAHKPALMRNFVNGWEGRVWEPRRAKTLPEQLGDRLGTTEPRGQVPAEAVYLSIGVDLQQAAGGFFPYTVVAWGAADRAWLVEWGRARSWDELLSDVLLKAWPSRDGGHPILAQVALIDSGSSTREVYEFCRGKRGIVPCKGGDQCRDQAYRIANLLPEPGARKSVGTRLVHVNTDYWETDLQSRFDDRRPGEPGSLSLPAEAGADRDLCEQLLNAALAEVLDRRGNAKLLWIKRHSSEPNDYRDCLRYAACGARIVLDERGGRLPAKRPAPPPPAVEPEVFSPRERGEGDFSAR